MVDEMFDNLVFSRCSIENGNMADSLENELAAVQR